MENKPTSFYSFKFIRCMKKSKHGCQTTPNRIISCIKFRFYVDACWDFFFSGISRFVLRSLKVEPMKHSCQVVERRPSPEKLAKIHNRMNINIRKFVKDEEKMLVLWVCVCACVCVWFYFLNKHTMDNRNSCEGDIKFVKVIHTHTLQLPYFLHGRWKKGYGRASGEGTCTCDYHPRWL